MKPNGNEPLDPIAVGQRLRAARRGTGLTQLEVAERLSIRRRNLYEWEKGDRIPARDLPRLADLYGVSASFLLYGVEPATVELARLRKEVREARVGLTELAVELTRLFAETKIALEVTHAQIGRLLEHFDLDVDADA